MSVGHARDVGRRKTCTENTGTNLSYRMLQICMVTQNPGSASGPWPPPFGAKRWDTCPVPTPGRRSCLDCAGLMQGPILYTYIIHVQGVSIQSKSTCSGPVLGRRRRGRKRADGPASLRQSCRFGAHEEPDAVCIRWRRGRIGHVRSVTSRAALRRWHGRPVPSSSRAFGRWGMGVAGYRRQRASHLPLLLKFGSKFFQGLRV